MTALIVILCIVVIAVVGFVLYRQWSERRLEGHRAEAAEAREHADLQELNARKQSAEADERAARARREQAAAEQQQRAARASQGAAQDLRSRADDVDPDIDRNVDTER